MLFNPHIIAINNTLILCKTIHAGSGSSCNTPDVVRHAVQILDWAPSIPKIFVVSLSLPMQLSGQYR